jgi:hypothetical protein
MGELRPLNLRSKDTKALGEEGRPCYGGIKTSELKVQRYKGPDGRGLTPHNNN